jgi:hypothetical protein
MNTDEAPTLKEVLRGVTFPAQKWEITTCAAIYGADLRTRRELYALPARSYEDADDIAEALDR